MAPYYDVALDGVLCTHLQVRESNWIRKRPISSGKTAIVTVTSLLKVRLQTLRRSTF